MIKILGFIPRRPDLTRAAFRDYYETRHVVLALKNIRRFTKYVRNHIVSGLPQDPSFDCLPEWWFEGPEIAAQIGEWVASPAGEVLQRDEANFMHRPGMASLPVSEHLLFGPARDVDVGVVCKIGLVLNRSASASASDFEAELDRFGKELIRRNEKAIERAGLDVPLDPRPAKLPLHAFISIWPATSKQSLDLPAFATAVGSLTEMKFDSIETPPAALQD